MSDALAGIGWIDWVFLAVVTLSIVVGLMRGLVYEVMSLLGWVAAYIAAQAFAAAVAPAIPIGAPGSGLNVAAAFVIVFVVVLIGWGLLSWLIKKLLQASPLSPFDRALGAVFGLLRGVLVALVAATAINMTPLAASPSWKTAHSAAGLQMLLSGLKPLLPDAIVRHLRA